MKTKFSKLILALVAMLSLIITSAFAQPLGANATASGSAGAGTLSYAITSANSANGGVPVVTYLNATSDKAAGVVQFYKVTARTTVVAATTGSGFTVGSTNGFADAGTAILRHTASDTYEKLTIGTLTNAANPVIHFSAAPATTTVAGDIIYNISSTGVSKIPVGAATISLNGPGIFAGQRNCPIYCEVDSTTTGNLNAIAVTFIP